MREQPLPWKSQRRPDYIRPVERMHLLQPSLGERLLSRYGTAIWWILLLSVLAVATWVL